MKRARKEQIKEIFAAPEPEGKRKFFRERELEPLHTGHFILQQLQYLSKESWIVSIGVLCLAMYLKTQYPDELLEMILAMMPFLAMTSVLEMVRSRYYGMEELEMASRFSLKSIILVRMEIIGLENLFVGVLLVLILQNNFFQSVPYLFVPYLLTTYGCLLMTRKCVDKERIYFCLGCAVITSGFMLITCDMPQIYQEKYFLFWLGIALFMVIMVSKELSRVIQLAESYE